MKRVKRVKEKMKRLIIAAEAMALTAQSQMVACAQSLQSVTVNNNVDAISAGGKILGMLITLAMFIGGGVAVFGIISLGLALSNPDSPPEKKTQGISMILGGVIIAGTLGLLRAVGIIAY